MKQAGMNVFAYGVGLIGGSFVRDLRATKPNYHFYGVDESDTNLDTALALGLIDHKATFKNLVNADLIVLAIPVDAILDCLPRILDIIKEDCLVIDLGSTKDKICQVVKQHNNRSNFLACHPIAGTEFSGPNAALSGLFQGKTNIICESELTKPKLLERALSIFEDLGMRIRFMQADSHDKHIAYVSHLSHISSFMLGKTVIEKERDEQNIFDMAGSGFESTVRLAKSSPAMWTPIFEQNKDYVLDTLDEYIQNLTKFKQMLDKDDYNGIYNVMNNTNRIKEILKGLPTNKKQ